MTHRLLVAVRHRSSISLILIARCCNNPAPTLVVGRWTFVDVSAPYSYSSSLQLISPDACRRCWFTVRPSVVVAVCVCCHISANTALRFAARPLAADADCKTHFVFAPSQFTARPPVVVAECGTCRILALLCNSQLDRQSSSLCVFQYNLLTSLRLEKAYVIVVQNPL